MIFLKIMKREFRIMFIDNPKLAGLILGAAVVYMVMFGALYIQNVVNRTPVVIYDQDQTRLSRELVQSFHDSWRYSICGYVTTQEEMEQYLRDKKAWAAVVIPPKFAEDISKGVGSQALIVANGSNILIANAITASSMEIVQEFSNGVAKRLLESANVLPGTAEHRVAPVELRLRLLQNPAGGYTEFFLITVLFAALQQGVLLSIGASMQKEYDELDAFRAVPPLMLIMGKVVPYVLVGLVSLAIALLGTVALFHVPFKGPAMEVLWLGAAFVFLLAALATLIAPWCRNEVTYTQLCISYSVPAFLLSGGTWPLMAMNGLTKTLSLLTPLTYIAYDARDIMLGGYSPTWQSHIGTMLGAACVVVFLSCLMLSYRRRVPCGWSHEND